MCMSVCVYAFICVCVYVCMHSYVHTYTYYILRMYIHMCVCILTSVCMQQLCSICVQNFHTQPCLSYLFPVLKELTVTYFCVPYVPVLGAIISLQRNRGWCVRLIIMQIRIQRRHSWTVMVCMRLLYTKHDIHNTLPGT